MAKQLHPSAVWAIGVMALAVVISGLMIKFQPVLEPQAEVVSAPAVSVVSVIPAEQQLLVESQGTVLPYIESHLTPEVSGRVVWVSPSLVVGGEFDEGDKLFEIDSRDYKNSLRRAEASLARAQVEDEIASAELARKEKLFQRKLVSQGELDKAARAAKVASAGLIDAEVTFDQAKLDLSRTTLHAPYHGQVRSEDVDIGQYVQKGSDLGQIYATDKLEVRLPIPNNEFAFLPLSPTSSGLLSDEESTPILLQSEYAGLTYYWQGRLVRIEAEVDAKTRVFYGVARIANYASESHPPLTVGLYVNASITGRLVPHVVSLPRTAMHDKNRVLLVDSDNKIRFRTVKVLRKDFDRVLIDGGLEDGDRVVISPLAVVVDGMQVIPVEEDATSRDDIIVEAE